MGRRVGLSIDASYYSELEHRCYDRLLEVEYSSVKVQEHRWLD